MSEGDLARQVYHGLPLMPEDGSQVRIVGTLPPTPELEMPYGRDNRGVLVMPVVALSIEYGCRSAAFAEVLAKALGLQLVDFRAIEEDLAERLFPDEDTSNHVSARGRGPFEYPWLISKCDVATLLRDEILERAKHGNAIIVGACAATVLGATHRVACVHLHGSMDFRSAIIQRRHAYPLIATAALEVEYQDATISKLVWQLFGQDWRDPSLYDLSIDVEQTNDHLGLQLIKRLSENSLYKENAQLDGAD
jgi:cytidylate kinase